MSNWNSIQIPDLPAPKGPYSPAIRAGPFVYVSGQTPRNMESGELVGFDVAAQTRQTLLNVKALLEAAGSSMADVISVTVYLTHVDDWAEMNTVYKEFFAPPYPTRTAVGAELRDILVEISAVAYVGT